MLNFKGDIIEVLGAFDDGWWSGKSPSGKIGLFPKEYQKNEIYFILFFLLIKFIYCEPVKTPSTTKLRIDESRASQSIKRMQMQLGFLHQSGAKVAELQQEVDALTADVTNFKNRKAGGVAGSSPNRANASSNGKDLPSNFIFLSINIYFKWYHLRPRLLSVQAKPRANHHRERVKGSIEKRSDNSKQS